MNRECTHDEYHSQFCTPAVIAHVRRAIGEEKIKESRDVHFNDIPLRKWDALEPIMRLLSKRAMLQAAPVDSKPNQYFWSQSDGVCIAKQAARIIKEQA